MEQATGKPVPEVKFFHIDTFAIGGHQVSALRHGMVGQPGWELWGPWDEGEAVRNAIVAAGRDLGLRQVGSRTYPTSCLESGWIPSPLPAVYTGEKLKPYRQWLTAQSYEATASLGGSMASSNIEDYYLTPYDLGYGAFVKFDHEFIGREALEKIAASPRRKKVTLVWNGADVTRAFASLFDDSGDPTKYIDLPLANYATLPYDTVIKNGRTVGISTYTGYNYNERAIVSLAMVDVSLGDPGTEVTVVWGEEGRGTTKPTVERHTQAEIRATVQPAPISETARVAYRPKALA
jgi:vanillate/3-O-methylgallate O-demethylase